MWHWLSPKLLGNGLLVKDLTQRSMDNEHWEGNRTKGGHRLASEEPSDGRGLGRQCISVHGGQELGEDRHKEHSTHDGVVEVELSKAQTQRSVGRQEKPNWVHLRFLLVFLSVQHHMSSSHNAHRHLHQSPEWMETGQVPNQRMHHLAIHRMFLAAVEASSLRVGDFLQQRHSSQSHEELLETSLCQLSHLWQHERWHGQVREGQG
mmetsp:Transcript_35944/g.58862  ORF Transcript_35944/g.58862 Transcript_35944/m.58862 type:complete len:206 (-) Transcript_35944:367-984(-)